MKKTFISIILTLSIILGVFPCVTFASDTNDYLMYHVEAEDGIFHENNNESTGGFSVATDNYASGKKVLRNIKGYMTLTDNPTPVTFSVNTEKAGRYNIFIKTKGQDTLWTAVNNDALKSVLLKNVNSTSEYKWEFVSTVSLVEGENTIKIAAREQISIDKIIVTDMINFYPSNVDDSNNLSNIFPEPSKYPTMAHPRLLVNPETLEAVRNNLEHSENTTDYKTVKTAADKDPTTIKANYPSSISSTIQYIESSAFLFLITEEEHYARNAVEKLISFLTTANEYVLTNSKLAGDRTEGMMVFLAAEVYDWCYPEITSNEREIITREILKLTTLFGTGFPPVKQNPFGNDHSMEYALLKDLFGFAIAVYDEHPEIYDAVAGRLFSEHIPLLNYLFENTEDAGMYISGDDYGTNRFSFTLWLATMLDKMGYSDVISEKQKEMAYQLIVRRRPDGYLLADGDSFNKKAYPPNIYYTAFLAANLFKDGYLESEYYEILDRYGSPENYQYYTVTPVLRVLLNDVNVPRLNKEDMGLSHYSGDLTGVMTARTGWDSESMLVSMKLPEQYFPGHNHLDAGHFEIYYKGALALDTGVYNGKSNGVSIVSGSDHDKNYHHRTIAHNSMLIYKPGETGFGIGTSNDGGQRIETLAGNIKNLDTFKTANKIGTVLGYDYGPDKKAPTYTYLKGNITNAYSSKVSDYTRTFLFLNLMDEVYPGALIVMDKVTSSDPTFKKTWLLHSQNEPLISGNIASFSNEGGGKLTNETLLPQNAEITKVGGDGYDFYVGAIGEADGEGVNYPATAAYTSYQLADELGKWRVQVSPSTDNTTDYFLNVIHVSDDDATVTPLESTLYETDEFFGVKIKNKVAFLQKGDEQIENKAIISAVGTDLEYVVCGLSEGTWKVKNSLGELVQQSEVTAGGVISFEGAGDTYSIVKKGTYADADIEGNETINPEFYGYVTSGDYLVKITGEKEDYNGLKIVPPYLLIVANAKQKEGYQTSYGVKLYKVEDGIAKSVEEPMIAPAQNGASETGNFGILFLGGLKKGMKYMAYPYAIYTKDGVRSVSYGECINIDFNHKEEFLTNQYNKTNNILLFEIK